MNLPASELGLDRAYQWERTTPDKGYLTQPMGGGVIKEYTWGSAMDEARRMAAHLRSLELPPKSHIALVSKNTAYWILADLAIWMAGHVTVPLYPTLLADTTGQILNHCEAKLLFVGKLDVWDEMKEGVPEDLPKIAMPLAPDLAAPKWEQIVAETDPITDNPRRDPEEMATIVYTSGSTGKPKGAMISFTAMAAAADGVAKRTSVGGDERMLSYLPLAHVFERFVVEMGSLMGGFHLYFAESLDTFVADLQRARPTVFVSVPRLWLRFQMGVFAKVPERKLNRLLSIPLISTLVRRKILKGLGLNHVRFAASGSAPLPVELIHWYRRLGLELLEGYGMTENFAYSHCAEPGGGRPGYVGTPYPGVEQRISEDGELLVKSPAMMMGYYKEPDLTREAITEDGFLKTGDRGEIAPDGNLKLIGRLKEQFKTSKGKYVVPAPIENLLMNHPVIEQVCVAGASQPQPHALVMLSEEARADLGQGVGKEEIVSSLGAHLEGVNAALDPHERLQFLAVVRDEWLIENGFLTPTMKIKRNVVEETYAPLNDGWYAAGSPVVWQEA